MGRLRDYFDRLAHPMQDVHRGRINRSMLSCRDMAPWLSIHSPTAPRGEGGAVRHQRGESHRRWLIDVMLIMPYDIESQSRNADFISIAPKGETTHYILRVAIAPSKCVRCAPQSGNPQPSAQRAVKLKNPWVEDPSILRTLFHNPSTQPAASAATTTL